MNTPALYRKKPVTIAAMQVLDDLRNHLSIRDWVQMNGGTVRLPFASPHLVIVTLEGNMRADIGDWIIRGVQGEFYPCKPDIFEQTYEPVEEVA